MAILPKKKPSGSKPAAKPLTARRVIRALAHRQEWHRQTVCPNLFLFDWEMDLCLITKSRRIWEFEVKLSLADWEADRKKSKWKSKNLQKVSRFYYVIPGHLLSSVPHWVSPDVGIMVIEQYAEDDEAYGVIDGLRVRVHRESKQVGKYKATDADVMKLYNGVYFRYWRHAQSLKLPMTEDDLCGSCMSVVENALLEPVKSCAGVEPTDSLTGSLVELATGPA